MKGNFSWKKLPFILVRIMDAVPTPIILSCIAGPDTPIPLFMRLKGLLILGITLGFHVIGTIHTPESWQEILILAYS
jgi:hypothetical protein